MNVCTRDPFVTCYNCNGFGKVQVPPETEKCEECECDGVIRTFCYKVVQCPICKGTGFKDAGQGQLF